MTLDTKKEKILTISELFFGVTFPSASDVFSCLQLFCLFFLLTTLCVVTRKPVYYLVVLYHARLHGTVPLHPVVYVCTKYIHIRHTESVVSKQQPISPSVHA